MWEGKASQMWEGRAKVFIFDATVYLNDLDPAITSE